MSTPLDHCRFNMNKGLWETHPQHWVSFDDFKAAWVCVAFPLATELERGVSDNCEVDI